MKVARLVLKIISMSLFVAAAVCAIVAYWEELVGMTASAKKKIPHAMHRKAEYADYEE